VKKLRIKLALRIAGLSILIFTGCREGSQEQKATTTSSLKELPVVRLEPVDTFCYNEYVAEIRAKQYIEIRSRVKGFLEHIYVDEGKYVARGTVLFHINDAEYRATLDRMEANLLSAIAEKNRIELEAERVKRLVDSNIVSLTELKIAQYNLEAAEAKIRQEEANVLQARLMLSYTDIRAPYDGFINRIMYKIGSLIDEGNLLTTLTDNSEVLAYFNVSEKEYLEYMREEDREKVSHEVEILLADGSLHAYKGMVETIEREVDPTTGSLAFRAKFPNPSRILKHGASGKVRIARKLKNVILIPQTATFDVQDRHYVFVMDSSHRLFSRQFFIQRRLGHFYVHDSGLHAGEIILYEGVQHVRDSMQVMPRFVSWRAAAK